MRDREARALAARQMTSRQPTAGNRQLTRLSELLGTDCRQQILAH